MKTEKHILVAHLFYCRLNKTINLYYIKLLSTGLKTSSLVCRPGLTCNIVHLLFFLPGPAIGKRISLLPARPIGKFSSLPAWSVGKLTSHLPVQPFLLEKSPHICRPSLSHWKNHFSFVDPQLRPVQTFTTGTCKTLIHLFKRKKKRHSVFVFALKFCFM